MDGSISDITFFLSNGHTTILGHQCDIVSLWPISHSQSSAFCEQFANSLGHTEMHFPVLFSTSCHNLSVNDPVPGLVVQ